MKFIHPVVLYNSRGTQSIFPLQHPRPNQIPILRAVFASKTEVIRAKSPLEAPANHVSWYVVLSTLQHPRPNQIPILRAVFASKTELIRAKPPHKAPANHVCCTFHCNIQEQIRYLSCVQYLQARPN